MSFTSRSSAFLRRAVLVIGTLIACIVIVTSATLITLTEESNRVAASDQLRRLEYAVDAEMKQAQHELAIVASGHSGRYADANAVTIERSFITRLEGAWHYFGFSSMYALDRANAVVVGAEYGVPAGQAGYRLLQPMVHHVVRAVTELRDQALLSPESRIASPGFEKTYARSALIHDGFGLAMATVVPFNPANLHNSEVTVLVAVRTLQEGTLREIGRRYGLGEVSFRGDARHTPAHALAVRNGAGEHIGYLTWVATRPGSAMLPNMLMIVLAGVIAIIAAFAVLFDRLRRLGIELASDEERANRLASHDHLSGLLNRRSFNERLEAELQRCERSHAGFALHLVDLDRFKEVNDTLGHQAGDEVIRETARRISDVVRGADIVARLGGDEFGIIQVDTDTVHEASALAQRLREVITRPITIGGAEISVGCSLGIALGPVGDTGADGIVKLADSALYEAKNDGRNRHRFYEASIDETLRMKQLVEEELRDAIATNQLEVHYQPQVSSDGHRIVGLEALVRWRHPVRGLIPPLDFIALAEQRGLIVPLGNWVLRRACEDGKRWPGLKIAVNLSAGQFKQHNFVPNLIELVLQTGFDPARLELELTEGMIVEDEDKAEAAISNLREHGISLALDDFGTGYSSLIYLRRFSFDKIKIDRSFLEAMETVGESAILVHSVVHLGRALGLTVCAEGIETEEQHRFLQAVGCHELQGYLFSKPLPADQIDLLLAQPYPFAKVA